MTQYVVLSAILFTIGCVGVLTRRNAIVVFMCVELMLNACNLAFVAFARQHVGSSRVDLQACKLEYSIVSPK